MVVEIVLEDVCIGEALKTNDFVEHSAIFVAEDVFLALVFQQHSLSFLDCLVAHIVVILSNNLPHVLPLLLVAQSHVL